VSKSRQTVVRGDRRPICSAGREERNEMTGNTASSTSWNLGILASWPPATHSPATHSPVEALSPQSGRLLVASVQCPQFPVLKRSCVSLAFGTSRAAAGPRELLVRSRSGMASNDHGNCSRARRASLAATASAMPCPCRADPRAQSVGHARRPYP